MALHFGHICIVISAFEQKRLNAETRSQRVTLELRRTLNTCSVRIGLERLGFGTGCVDVDTCARSIICSMFHVSIIRAVIKRFDLH